ncbi:MAG: hypothetical protein ACI9F2_000876 [Lysobacterales bacterium]|jgi:hypothetical protein
MLFGCQTTKAQDTQRNFIVKDLEPEWIRNGEAIEFEGEMWHPQDGIEGFKDSEMYYLGEYRNTQIFIDKVDVRPYNRIYTKFSTNKFRYFKK